MPNIVQEGHLVPAQRERELGLTDLARRVGDDITDLAKSHFELARVELGSALRRSVADLVAILLGGVLALIGLGMLCVTAVVAVEPLIPALSLRLLIGALVYMALGAALVLLFVKRLRGEEQPVAGTKDEAVRTAHALNEQVQHG